MGYKQPDVLMLSASKVAVVKSLRAHLNGIAAQFVDPHVTLIVREAGGADLIMTNDSTAEATAALARYEETKPA